MRVQTANNINPTLASQVKKLIGKCVHCGFCNANCPTYRELNEELDGPRGRIYLIKNMFEDGIANAEIQTHLDRCLTCRRCETTCPSSVEYGKLIDLARNFINQQKNTAKNRSIIEKLQRTFLLNIIAYPKRLKPLIQTVQFFRPILPPILKKNIAKKESTLDRVHHKSNQNQQTKTVILPTGCVQSVMKNNTNIACQQLLEKLGYTVIIANNNCCGALAHHLGEEQSTYNTIKKNIEQWYTIIQQTEKENKQTLIVIPASGCGLMVKEYLHQLDPINHQQLYQKAKIISQSTVDLSQVIELKEIKEKTNNKTIQPAKPNIVFHPPCTLQHGQKIQGKIENILTNLGYNLLHFADSDQCCGSAGAYSIFQAKLAQAIKNKKLKAIHAAKPQQIITANIGCQLYLENDTKIPIRHWIEVLNESINSE